MYPFYYLILIALVSSGVAVFAYQRIFLLPTLRRQEAKWRKMIEEAE